MSLTFQFISMSVASAPGTGNISLGIAAANTVSYYEADVAQNEEIIYTLVDDLEFETGVGIYDRANNQIIRSTVTRSSKKANEYSKIDASENAIISSTYIKNTSLNREFEPIPEHFGAIGDGVTDDTEALDAWFSYVKTVTKRGRLSPKTYVYNGQLKWDLDGANTTGIEINGVTTQSSIIQVNTSSSPAVKIFCSGGTVPLPVIQANSNFRKFGFATNVNGISLQIGTSDFTDQLNRNSFDLTVTNGSAGSSAVGVQLNAMFWCEIRINTVVNGLSITPGSIGIEQRKVAFSSFYIGAASTDIGLKLTSDYNYGNGYYNLDLEVVNIAVVIDGVSCVDNTFYNGTYGYEHVGVRANTGSNNLFVAPNKNAANSFFDTGANSVGVSMISGARAQIEGPTNGSTITIGEKVDWVYLVPSPGNIAAATIALPTSPGDGARVVIITENEITSVTWAGNVWDAPATLTEDSAIELRYYSGNGYWYRTVPKASGDPTAAGIRANLAYSLAQTAFTQANTAIALGSANTNANIIIAAFNTANTANLIANEASNIGTGAFTQANTGLSLAQIAFARANLAISNNHSFSTRSEAANANISNTVTHITLQGYREAGDCAGTMKFVEYGILNDTTPGTIPGTIEPWMFRASSNTGYVYVMTNEEITPQMVGAYGNGGTNSDLAAFTAILTYPYVKKVKGKFGSHYRDSGTTALPLRTGIEWDLFYCRLDNNSITASTNNPHFYLNSTQGSQILLSATATAGTDYAVLASVSGLTVGQLLFFADTTSSYSPNSASYSYGEVKRIRAIDTSSNTVYCYENFLLTYSLTNASKAFALATTDRTIIRRVKGIGDYSTSSQLFFRSQYCDGVEIRDWFTEGFGYASMVIQRCHDVNIKRCKGGKANARGLAYHCVISNGTTYVNYSENEIYEVRHAFTSGGTGVCMNLTARDNKIRGCRDAGLDVHPPVWGGYFINNEIWCSHDTGNGSNDGIVCQGANCHAIGNKIYGALRHGVNMQQMVSAPVFSPMVSIQNTVVLGNIPYIDHTAVECATTANLTATYSNGTAGVGATLTNAGANAAFSVDSYSPTINQRVLVKNQTSEEHNGIYTLTTVGDGSTPWVLTRATDFNTVGYGATKIHTGARVLVNNGSAAAGLYYYMSGLYANGDNDYSFVVGTDDIYFVVPQSRSCVTYSVYYYTSANVIYLIKDNITTVPTSHTGLCTHVYAETGAGDVKSIVIDNHIAMNDANRFSIYIRVRAGTKVEHLQIRGGIHRTTSTTDAAVYLFSDVNSVTGNVGTVNSISLSDFKTEGGDWAVELVLPQQNTRLALSISGLMPNNYTQSHPVYVSHGTVLDRLDGNGLHYGSANVDLPSIAVGSNTSFLIPVADVNPGDSIIKFSAANGTGNLIMSSTLVSNGNVLVVVQNMSNAAVDLASQTYRVWCEPSKFTFAN